MRRKETVELTEGTTLTSNTSKEDDDGWFVSSYTNGHGLCIEVKFADGDRIFIRDSKDRGAASPIISVSSRGWASLLRDVNTPA